MKSKGSRDIIVEVSTKLQNRDSHASEFSSGDAIKNRNYNHIPSPPKRKSLSKLTLTFSPFRSRSGDNSGAKCNTSRNPSSLGTPHTTPMSISSRSTDNSGSDFESSSPIVVIRPAATETVHHHHHYHHHVIPDVKDNKKKKNESLPSPWRSHLTPPSPPPPPLIPSKVNSHGHNRPSNLIPTPLRSTDECPSPTRSTNTSSSSSCSGGGWSSATTTESVSPPSSDVAVHRVGIAPRIMASYGAAAI